MRKKFSEKYDLNSDSGKKPWWYIVGYTVLEWIEDTLKKLGFNVKWYFTSEEMKEIWFKRTIFFIVLIVVIVSIVIAS